MNYFIAEILLLVTEETWFTPKILETVSKIASFKGLMFVKKMTKSTDLDVTEPANLSIRSNAKKLYFEFQSHLQSKKMKVIGLCTNGRSKGRGRGHGLTLGPNKESFLSVGSSLLAPETFTHDLKLDR